MTCSYNAYYLIVWGSVALALPFGARLVFISIALFQDLPFEGLQLLGCGVVLLLWAAFMRRHASRLKVRAGAWPALCSADAYPRDEKQLKEAVKDIKKKYHRKPEIVGAGWGHLITRRGAVGPRIFTHRMLGQDKTKGMHEYWLCGTTIRSVVEHYKKAENGGVTFSTHPTMDYISIGSWFAFGNHGNGGNHEETKGSSETMRLARVLDMNTSNVEEMSYERLRHAFDTQPRRYCVISVAFQNLVKNKMVQKRGIVVDSYRSANEWLKEGAYLRVLFQGAARDYAVGVRWEGKHDEGQWEEHLDPHWCSRFCLYAQTDACSMWGGWHESMAKYRGRSSYADANRWMPSISPVETAFVVAMGYYNFEIIFKLDAALTGVFLFELTRSLIRMHNSHGGRSEIRYGKRSPTEPIFLDVVLRRSADFSAPFRMLERDFGVSTVALHPGKYLPDSTAPCERVSLHAMYYGTSTYANATAAAAAAAAAASPA